MKNNVTFLLFIIICSPTISGAMPARMFPRLVTAHRNFSIYTGSRDYDVGTVVNAVHRNMAQRYVQCIKNIKDPKERDTLISFLRTRTRNAHVLLTSLNNVFYAPHHKDPDNPKPLSFFLEFADHERLFLNPHGIDYTENEVQKSDRVPKEPRHAVSNIYPCSVQSCLISTLRARLGCKSGKPNKFERTLLNDYFNVDAFEKRHNIILEEVAPQEEKERCIAFWQHYVEQHATGMNQEQKNIHFAIDHMRLEHSYQLAGYIILGMYAEKENQ